MKTRIAVTACLVSLLIGRSAWTQIAPPTYDYIKTGVLEAKIDSSSGSPQLVINGQAIPPLLFFFNNSYPDRMQFLAPQVRAANAAGIHLFSMVFYNWPWDPGDAAHPPDYSQSNSQMDQFLAIDPHAAFLLRIPAGPPPSWSGWATHAQWGKNEDILHSDGTTTIDSVASNVYLQALLSGVTNMVQHYEASAYASHILGYHITGANTGEWFPDQYREKGLDYSPANTTAFRSWLQQKYGTDAALSNAWGRSVTINTAPIPIPVAGRFPIHSAASAATTDPVPSFYRLPAEQDWVDYSAYTSDIFSSQILAIAHAVRTATINPAISR